MNDIIFLFCCFLIDIHSVRSWKEINYTSVTTDEWRDNFKNLQGPHGRSGHTLVLYQKTKLILFGGRDNDVQRHHVPTTMEVVDKDGVLEFSTYDSKPIREVKLDPIHSTPEERHTLCNFQESCISFTNATASGNTQACTQQWTHPFQQSMTQRELYEWEEICGFVPVAVFYNDVWMLDLTLDVSSNNATWVVLHPGSNYGYCPSEHLQNATEKKRRCQTPSERWRHGAAMLDEHTMVVFGGNSQSCDDYCDDFWAFDLRTNLWYEIISPSTSSSTAKDDTVDGPGVRWRFTMLGGFLHPELNRPAVIFFGGHRSWDNIINSNASNSIFKTSGYLNDLWMYVKGEEDESSQSNNSSTQKWSNGGWIRLEERGLCTNGNKRVFPRDTIAEDGCRAAWPQGRAGYAAVYDKERNGIWMHGGYSAYYPYGPFNKQAYTGGDIETDGTTLPLQQTVIMSRVAPYHSQSYYLNDLWFYDIATGIWELKKPVHNPAGRTGHTIVITEDGLVLFGGYSTNSHFNDTWHYFPKENKWLKKDTFEYALYPDGCTDDIQVIASNKNCTLLSYPRNQFDYTPNPTKPLYFGIVDNATELVQELQERYLKNVTLDENGNRIWIASNVPDGTPIAPNAATGPRQYAQIKVVAYNSTSNIHIWERCTSVYGEPTRGRLIDGLYGRSNGRLFIPQPRRKSPGWDGCREMYWVSPSHRSDHASIFVDALNAIVTFGGRGYVSTMNDNPATLDFTHETHVLEDLWVMNVDGCLNNCSNNGVCSNGFCNCEPGFYGLDCSNKTCPGSVCYYDANFAQQCIHCCHDGYVHSDEDVPVTGVRKIPCQRMLNGNFTGRSEGICDGFGSCMCAPPFVGDDCSIKDCKNNCSLNGYCSVEYPVSRCVCREGYYGDFCQHRICLNNCSFPNGLCNSSSGDCTCAPILSPYNYSQIYAYWEGEDCSYLTAWFSSSFALSEKSSYFVLFSAIVLFTVYYSFQ